MSEVLRDAQTGDVRSWTAPNVAPPTPQVTAATERRNADQGYRDGFERGLNEAHAAGAGEIQQVVMRFGQLIESLQAPFAELDHQVSDQLLALTLTVAGQVIGDEPTVSAERITHAIHAGLAELPAANRPLTIHLHPDDHALVAQSLMLDGDPPPRMVDDPSITRGGCRVKAVDSIVDATVETRLASIAATLLEGQPDG